MTTIKSFSDLEQSRKLAEILPLESADICLTFVNNIWNPVWDKADDIYKLQKDCYEPDYTKDEYVDFDEFEPKVVPCWSLAALLGILPKGKVLINDIHSNKYKVIGYNLDTTDYYDEPLDACYEMVLKLHELKIL